MQWTSCWCRWTIPASLVLCLSSPVLADEYRAFWVDAWGAGINSQAQVETLLGRVGDPNLRGQIRDANCNAVVIQVRRRADVCYPSALGEPYYSGLSPANFNALQAAINAAHDTTGGKQRIEVHAWVVVFKTAKGTVYSQHSDINDPANYWPTRLSSTSGSENSDGAFDPGHPQCLKYLVDVAMDLVTNFDIDGIHYDYIRFEASTEGYNPTSVARYNERYGLSGSPSSSSEQFKQWRRDQVTSFVRQVYARIQPVKPMLKQSGSFVTWNPSPTASTRAAFMATRPYYDVYSDWDSWIQEGIIDVAFPMTYYNWASLPNDYTRWMNWEKDRKGNRHMVVGPGIYLNSLSNAILELQQTRNASLAGNYAHGFCGYSYRVPYSGGTWAGFAPSLVSQVTPGPVSIPVMTWKTNPTTGHIMGTVTQNGQWADHAQVNISGPVSRSMYVDGTGFYAFIDVPPGTYSVSATKTGAPGAGGNVTVAIGQVTGNMYQLDLALGGANPPPSMTNVAAGNITNNAATITWTTDQASDSQVQYSLDTSYSSSTPVDPALVFSHSVNVTGLSPNTTYNYRAVSANAQGQTFSGGFSFRTLGPPTISDVQATQITSGTATITWTTAAPATSQVNYGLTAAYGSQTPLDSSLVTAHSVLLSGLSPQATYHYQVLSTNAYGSAQSADVAFTTTAPITEIIVDNTDPGWANTSPGGAAWSAGSNPDVPKIGTNYLYATGVGSTSEASATRSCTWTPNLPVTGLYDVYVYYQIGANRTTGAPYKVFYDGGSVTSVQNQYSPTPNQGGWFLVGADLPFQAGSTGYVRLANNTPDTGLTSADAARWVLKSDQTPPTTPVVTDDGVHNPSLSVLHASWAAEDPESGIKKYEYRIRDAAGPVITDWTDAGLATQATVSALPLIFGHTCIWDVRATNATNQVSDIGSSDGIIVYTFDVNADNLVNDIDVESYLLCLNGSDVTFPGDVGVDCARFDLDLDNDVDLTDFSAFQRCLNGLSPLNTDCLD